MASSRRKSLPCKLGVAPPGPGLPPLALDIPGAPAPPLASSVGLMELMLQLKVQSFLEQQRRMLLVMAQQHRAQHLDLDMDSGAAACSPRTHFHREQQNQ